MAMETWLVACPEALEEYFGNGFKKAKLPQASDLESVSILKRCPFWAQRFCNELKKRGAK